MIRALITDHLWPRLAAMAISRPPDFVIGGPERPYLLRWFVIPRNRWFNIYLHQLRRSDDDRALHDHPWANVSILLAGEYVEHTIARGGVNVRTRRVAGDVKLRSPWAAHRLELLNDEAGGGRPCWSLFITGPRVRSWGFHCPQGWRHWKMFTAEDDRGQVGRGCE